MSVNNHQVSIKAEPLDPDDQPQPSRFSTSIILEIKTESETFTRPFYSSRDIVYQSADNSGLKSEPEEDDADNDDIASENNDVTRHNEGNTSDNNDRQIQDEPDGNEEPTGNEVPIENNDLLIPERVTPDDEVNSNDGNDDDEESESSEEEDEDNKPPPAKKQRPTIDKAQEASNSKEKKPERIPHTYTDEVVSHVEVITIREEERLAEHMKTLNSRRHMPYICQSCAVGYVQEEPYKEHLKTHAPIAGGAECDICHTWFRNEDALYRHKLRHFRRYKCTLCKPSVPPHKDKDTAACHVMRAHLKATFQCDICGKDGFNNERENPSYNQMVILWRYLKSNKSDHSGVMKELSKRKWRELTKLLNADKDGSHKAPKSWAKFWKEYKLIIKGRIRNTIGRSVKPAVLEDKFTQVMNKHFDPPDDVDDPTNSASSSNKRSQNSSSSEDSSSSESDDDAPLRPAAVPASAPASAPAPQPTPSATQTQASRPPPAPTQNVRPQPIPASASQPRPVAPIPSPVAPVPRPAAPASRPTAPITRAAAPAGRPAAPAPAARPRYPAPAQIDPKSVQGGVRPAQISIQPAAVRPAQLNLRPAPAPAPAPKPGGSAVKAEAKPSQDQSSRPVKTEARSTTEGLVNLEEIDLCSSESSSSSSGRRRSGRRAAADKKNTELLRMLLQKVSQIAHILDTRLPRMNNND